MPRPNTQFQEAIAALRGDIRSGLYPQATFLPGEHRLSQQLGVGRSTLRTVLKQLLEEGLVCNHPGRGWEVCGSGVPQAPLALVLSRLEGPELELVEPLRQRCAARGWQVQLHFNEGLTRPIEDVVQVEQTAAVIYLGGHHVPEQHLNMLSACGIPVVAAGLSAACSYDTIGTDNSACAEKLFNHLVHIPDLRPVHIACIGQEYDPSFVQRQEGYLRAMQGWGAEPQIYILPAYRVTSADVDDLFQRYPADGHTCFICGGYNITRDLLRHCVQRGIAIPQEYGVIGYQGKIDQLDCDLLHLQQVTAFDFPVEDIAEKTIRLCAQHFAGEQCAPQFYPQVGIWHMVDSIQ